MIVGISRRELLERVAPASTQSRGFNVRAQSTLARSRDWWVGSVAIGSRAALGAALCLIAAACGNSSSPAYAPRIVLKIADGVDIKLAGQAFVLAQRGTAGAPQRLQDPKLSDVNLTKQLGELNRLLQSENVARVAPLFSGGAKGLTAPPRESGTADLTRYYSVVLRDSTPQETVERMVRSFAALPIVETVYQAPVGEDPSMGTPRN